MKKTIRTTAALLALLAAGSTLAACGDAATVSKVTESVNTEAVTEDTAETEPVQIMPDLPQKDYGGRTFTFMTSSELDDNGKDWITTDIYAEAATGDVVTDAVYERNVWLEETFNIKIAEHQCVTLAETKKAVQAGVTDYDVVMTSIKNGCTLGSGNFVLDLQTVPYIDLNAPWWDHGVTEGTIIAGRTYVATGDVTIIDNDATWTLMFNKQMAQNLDYNFYEMVRNNTWDYETFYNCAKTGSKDLDGDGKMDGSVDQFGFMTSDQSCIALIYASGVMLSARDAEQYPFLQTDISLLTTTVEKAGKIMADKNTTIMTGAKGVTTSDDLRIAFESGRGLFFGEVMQCVTRMRESKTDFGLIPFPKLDVSQDGYYHFVHSTAGKGLCIPSTQADTEMAGIIVEAMAAKSKYTVTEAYYNKALTYKYMRDEDSVEMLDIILSSRVYDLAYIYDWGSIFTGIMTLVKSGKTDVASTWDKKMKSADKAMQKTIDAYKENE